MYSTFRILFKSKLVSCEYRVFSPFVCVLKRNNLIFHNCLNSFVTNHRFAKLSTPKCVSFKNCFKMSTQINCDEVLKTKLIYPPKEVYNLNTLNYDLFKKNVSLPYIITETEHLSKVSKCLKDYFLKMPLFKPVQNHSESNRHKIFLNPDLLNSDSEIKIKSLISEKLLISSNTKDFIHYEDYELTYDNFNYQTILRSILPEEIDSISGFSTIGHIIHLNLREHSLPYKHIIGQVLLDKIKGCRLVINKLNIIDTKFRNFEMEILAKDKDDPSIDTIVSTTESDIRFKFDFAKVYWNPRLSAERSRINGKLRRNVDVLYDVFAGVGPFALSTAKFLKCKVLANDLNPESYKWLCENVKINKVENLVHCFNLDGREFIRTTLKDDLIKYVKTFDGSDINRCYHVVMNLPEIAVEFLDSFDGLLSCINDSNHTYKIPFLNIHCYCFVKNIPENEANDFVIRLASDRLGHPLSLEKDIDDIFNVRKVAPNKLMYRISFKLHQDILYGTIKSKNETLEPNQQKCVNNLNEDPILNKRLKTK